MSTFLPGVKNLKVNSIKLFTICIVLIIGKVTNLQFLQDKFWNVQGRQQQVVEVYR